MMGRISRQPAEVQVAFIRLCCVYWNAECEMSIEHAELEADGHLQRLLAVHLVETNGTSVFIKFLDIQWEDANLHRTKMSEAGKRSAERRATKVEENPTKVEPMLNLPSTYVEPVFNREEKRREEKREKKDCVIFDQFWALYPRKTSKQLASKAFAKLSDENQQKAIANIARLYANTEVQFVPHAATYLNQARWEDEAIVRTNTFARPLLNQSEDADLPRYR